MIFEDNDVTGVSLVAGGQSFGTGPWGGYTHNYLSARNTLRFTWGNDREVMTYDAEGVQYFGSVSALNGSLLTAPNCPGILGARFEPPKSEAPSTMPVSNPRGGMVLITDGPGAGQYRRIVDWGVRRTIAAGIWVAFFQECQQ